MGGEPADEIRTGIRTAQRLNIAPSEFWHITPFHLAERAKGYGDELTVQYKRTLTGAWHGAYLQRVEAKRFPSLARVLAPAADSPAMPQQGVDEPALKAAFQRHNERFRRANGEAR